MLGKQKTTDAGERTRPAGKELRSGEADYRRRPGERTLNLTIIDVLTGGGVRGYSI